MGCSYPRRDIISSLSFPYNCQSRNSRRLGFFFFFSLMIKVKQALMIVYLVCVLHLIFVLWDYFCLATSTMQLYTCLVFLKHTSHIRTHMYASFFTVSSEKVSQVYFTAKKRSDRGHLDHLSSHSFTQSLCH